MDENDKQYMLVYGLSANPPHQSHIDLVVGGVKALVAREYSIARVLVIPVYRRNLASENKEDLPRTFENRFAMSKLAAWEMAQRLGTVGTPVTVSRIEEELAKAREHPNMTLETLSALHEANPDTGLIFLLSSDIVSGEEPELAHWHQPEQLLQMASMAICPRVGYPRNEGFLNGFGRGAHFLFLDEVVVRDMAASSIMARLKAGENPLTLSEEGWLPISVAMYIAKMGY